jgi:hypothetical protein
MGVVGTALQPTAFLTSHPDRISPFTGLEFLQNGPSPRAVAQEVFVRDWVEGDSFSLLFPYTLKAVISDVYREVFPVGKFHCIHQYKTHLIKAYLRPPVWPGGPAR